MVEFALIAPLFFLFVFAIIEGALYINAQSTLDNMTREVARTYAVCGTTAGHWIYRGQGYINCKDAALSQKDANIGILPPASLSSMTVAFCAPDSNIPANAHCSGRADAITAAGQQVEVSVNITYTFWVDPLLGTFGPTIPMTSSARMVAQQ
jgi:Flp pilus assembly protein TadG